MFLCILIADLTQRYGPVVRQAKVVGVLDAAFDVYVSDFGIEKRVHVDQMPIDVRDISITMSPFTNPYGVRRIIFTTSTSTLFSSTGPNVMLSLGSQRTATTST